MFLFPVIYIYFFFTALYLLLKGGMDAFMLFVIFGMPVYITSLSITFMFGFKSWIPVLQSFKEIIILFTLVAVIFSLKKKPVFGTADWLVFLFFGYSLSYILLPIGTFSTIEKLLAFKSVSFFPFIYFTGRLFNPSEINLNKYFQYICILSIAAAVLLIFEVITYTHVQTYTGYAEYMFYYFNQEPAGHYGLSWTFEVQDGPKRFASFFSNPLEYAAATLVSVSAIAALMITRTKKIRINTLIVISFIATLLAVIFAISRASFASYFIMLYAFLFLIKKSSWLKLINYGMLAVIIAGFIWLNNYKGDLNDFITNTINFSNSSSLSHILEWIDGINAIVTHPLGLGLGSSGRVGAALGINVGGENQLLIIGVQTGLIPLIVYISLYIYFIRVAAWVYRNTEGKSKKLALFVFLLKLGLIIPLLTSEVESYVYISYIAWFFSALLMNVKYNIDDYRRRYQGSPFGKNRTENNAGGTLPAIQIAGE
jgi:hypothetical protein